jgi:DNA-binding IclR family transcriptional regulator
MTVINKSINILRAFVDVSPEWGVRDLAKYLKLPPSTLHRFLLQLQEEEILEFNPSTYKYVIGMELIRFSSAISSKIDIKTVSRPILQKLVDKHNHTMCLILYLKKEQKIMFLDKISGENPIQYVIDIGVPHAVPYGSSGKSILAFLKQEEIDQIIEKENFSTNEVEKLTLELNMIRANGYVTSKGDRIKGSNGIGAPIFDSSGSPIGSIVYSIPITQFNKSEERALANDLVVAANYISRILGYKKGTET